MAYFPNGTAGMKLDEQCDDCIHEDPEVGCPIYFVSVEFNYDQCDNQKLSQCLTGLVDQKGNCLMRPHIMKLKGHVKKQPDPEKLEIFKKNSKLFKQ